MKGPWKTLACIKSWGLSSSSAALRDPFDLFLTVFESAVVLIDRVGCSCFVRRFEGPSRGCGADP